MHIRHDNKNIKENYFSFGISDELKEISRENTFLLDIPDEVQNSVKDRVRKFRSDTFENVQNEKMKKLISIVKQAVSIIRFTRFNPKNPSSEEIQIVFENERKNSYEEIDMNDKTFWASVDVSDKDN